MPRGDIFFSQIEKRIIVSVFVRGIMQQFTQFFWLQHTLFNISNSMQPNYKGTTSSAEGVAWTSPDSSIPWRAWTARARSSLLAALIILIIFCQIYNISKQMGKTTGYHLLPLYGGTESDHLNSIHKRCMRHDITLLQWHYWSNFERGPKPKFIFFFNVQAQFWQNAEACITLL